MFMKSIVLVVFSLVLSFGSQAFDFVELRVEDETLIFTTVEERENYPFYVEQWINESWMVIGEVYGKGGIDTNIYQIGLENMFFGINKFRVKKETGWDYFNFSSPTSIFNTKNKVLPFTDKKQIIFSDTAFYKVVNDENQIFLNGKGSGFDSNQLPHGKYVLWCNNRKTQLIVRRNRSILKERW